MTLTELCEELKTITYGESTDDLSELATVVNLSLQRLYSDVKMTSVYSFYKQELLPIEKPLSFHKKSGDDLTLPLAGRAYGMHISGKGTFRIVTPSETEETTFDTYGEFFSGRCPEDGAICFTGDCSYDVYSLSFYDEIGSDDLSDIPSGYPKRYTLSDMIPHFGAPAAMPKDDFGSEIDGAEYIGDSLFIPTDYKGRVSVEYYVLPERVSAHLCDREISVNEKYLSALLHLTAYYSLLESEGSLAEKHMESYLAMISVIKPKREYSATGEYLIEDGWA